MIKFKCNDCGSKNKVPDEYAGRPVKCPKCGRFAVVTTDYDKDTDKDIIEILDEEVIEAVEDTSNTSSENSIFPKKPEKVGLLSATGIVSFISITIISACIGIIISDIYKINTLEEEVTAQKGAIQQVAIQKGTILVLKEDKEELKNKLYGVWGQNRNSAKEPVELMKSKKDVSDKKDEIKSRDEKIAELQDKRIAELEKRLANIDKERKKLIARNKMDVFADVVIRMKSMSFNNPSRFYNRFSGLVRMSFDRNFGNESGLMRSNFFFPGGDPYSPSYSPEQLNTLFFDSIVHNNVKLVDMKTIQGIRLKNPGQAHRDGKVAYFDGKDSYLEIPSMPLHLTKFSISFWIKRMGPGNYGIVEQKSLDPSFKGFYIQTVDNHKPYMSFHSDNVTSSISLDNRWHYLVFQYSGDSQEIWIDGQLKGRNSLSTPPQGSGGKMYIGKAPDGLNNKIRSFHGYIDDFEIFHENLGQRVILSKIATKRRLTGLDREKFMKRNMKKSETSKKTKTLTR